MKSTQEKRLLYRVLAKVLAWGGILLLMLVFLRSCFA